MPERLLLTGAGGFVGSHILRHVLANTSAHVVCPVTFTHRGLSDRIDLALGQHPEWAPRVTVVRCDLAAPISDLTAARFGGVDAVINAASESHVDRSIDHPAPFIVNNVALMANMLDWARTQPGLQAFVQVSTDEVYGPADAGHAHREWADLHRPSNPYSASKAAQEDIAFAYWRTYGVPVVITNTMNIVGETQDPEKFVPMVMRRVLLGEPVPIHGDPATGKCGSRFYLHARNQADALLWLLRTTTPARYGDGATEPDRWHVVGEREVTNVEMAQLIAEIIGRPLRAELVDFHSSRPGHDLRYALDGSKLAAHGWRAPVQFEESVARTVAWTLDHPGWLGLDPDVVRRTA